MRSTEIPVRPEVSAKKVLAANSNSFPPRLGFSFWIGRSIYRFGSEDHCVLTDLMFDERNRVAAMPAHLRSYGVDCLVPDPISLGLRYQNVDDFFGFTHRSVPRLFQTVIEFLSDAASCIWT